MSRAGLTVQLESGAAPGADDGGVIELTGERLDSYAKALAECWDEIGIGPGSRVVVYDHGSSPPAYLASELFAPYLSAGAAELTGALVLCVDGLPDNAARVAHVLRHFRAQFLFARLECAPLLFSGPTAIPEQLRSCRLIVSGDLSGPGERQLLRWQAEWPGGVEVLNRDDARARLWLQRPGQERRNDARAAGSQEDLAPCGPQGACLPAAPQLDRFEFASAAALERLTLERLRQSVEQASRLPFYKRIAAGAIELPGSLSDYAEGMPTFNKSDLIAAMRDGEGHESGIEALEGRTAAIVLTSGTLGFPTFASLGARELAEGSTREVMREFLMDGMRPGMRVLCQYPAWHHLSILDNRALEWIGAEVVCPWGTFTPRYAPAALSAIERQRPEYLLTVTTMLHALIEEVQRQGTDLRQAFASVRYAMVAGEPVSARQREALCEALGLEDLFERGGSSDGLWGGAECPAHRGHHVWADHHHVEIMDLDSGRPLPPGRRGSVVVSNLTGDRSLYLRFDTEDLGELLGGECPCGRAHPRVELYGRLADCVRVQGQLIAPYDVRDVLDHSTDLIGVPLVIDREAAQAGTLRVLLDGDARAPGLAELAQACLSEHFDLPVQTGFAGSLPKRWKARLAVDGRGVGAPAGQADRRSGVDEQPPLAAGATSTHEAGR